METCTTIPSNDGLKKSINMTQFAKNVESNLEKFQNVRTYNYNEPFPVNYSKNLTQTNKPPQSLDQTKYILGLTEHEHEHMENSKPVENVITENKEENKSIFNTCNQYRDVFLYVLIFILLNNKFIIEIIYNKVPFIKTIDNPYPNLIIRSLIFGILIIVIKKYNL